MNQSKNDRIDPNLFRRLRDGDPKAFHEFVEAYKPEVCRLISTMLRGMHEKDDLGRSSFQPHVESLFAASLVDIIIKIRDGSLSDFRPIAYLLQTAKYKQIDKFRRRKREKQVAVLDDLDRLQNDVDSLVQEEDLSEIKSLLAKSQDAFKKLPMEDQKLIHLKYVVGLSWKEIATELEYTGPVSSLRARASRILQMLRRNLDKG